MPTKLISTICECILNCINGNINLDTETKIKLNRHKNVLRNLSVKKKIYLNKREYHYYHYYYQV